MTPQTKVTKHLNELKSLLENDDKKSFNEQHYHRQYKSKQVFFS